MPSSQNHQVLPSGAFSRCHLRPSHISPHAAAYSWTGAPSCALDSSVPNGSNRPQSRPTTYSTTSPVSAFLARSATVTIEGCQLSILECHQRKPAAHWSEKLAKVKKEGHQPASSKCQSDAFYTRATSFKATAQRCKT